MLRAAAVLMVATLGVSACRSEPSAQRVAEDLINTCMQESNPCELTTAQLTGDPAVARQCMLDKVEAYGKDELQKIGDAAANGDVAAKAAADDQLKELQDDLESCMTQ